MKPPERKSTAEWQEPLKGSLSPAYRKGVIGKLRDTLMKPLWNRRYRPKPILIEADYKGYNIVRIGYTYYGIAQCEGAFDLKKYRRGKYRYCFEAGTIDELKNLLAEAPVPGGAVLEGEHRGFNIMCFSGKYYGISRSLGQIDPTLVEGDLLEELIRRGYCVVADSRDEVVTQIELHGRHAGMAQRHVGRHKGFNIVYFSGRYYGLAEELGDVDLAVIPADLLAMYLDNGYGIVSESLEELKALIEQNGRPRGELPAR